MAVVSGGTTLIDNGALDAGVPTGSLILLSTQTASASATIDFTSGIDSTYDSYVFKFINIHPATDDKTLQFNMSTDGGKLQFNLSTDSGSSYNVAKTTTFFKAYHNEAGSSTALTYEASDDLAQGTGSQFLSSNIDNDNDACWDGYMCLYNPSSTTFVKHFMSVGASLGASTFSYNDFVAGYGNTTSAVNAVQFSMSSGNIDDGIIKLYGVK